MKVWMIRYSNYEPPEIYGIYSTEELAERICKKLPNPMWEVREIRVMTPEEYDRGFPVA